MIEHFDHIVFNVDMIEYIKGDATHPIGDSNKIIAHICNDAGYWGKGFVLAISKRWSAPEQSYRMWFKNKQLVMHSDFALGEVQVVYVESDVQVANMIAQHDIKIKNNEPPIRYHALASCFDKIANGAQVLNASVHMPRIGCGLAGGTWEIVETIIDAKLVQQGIKVYVYDYEKENANG